ncbi:hypothetical protein Tco_0804281 [Tanacetum coccineum]|uniref:CCHC-type domain-containing protein n=1 Tax=Tanacetum coccineum TaxID=301880 RepID=A0ABQ5A872_9ASTR
MGLVYNLEKRGACSTMVGQPPLKATSMESPSSCSDVNRSIGPVCDLFKIEEKNEDGIRYVSQEYEDQMMLKLKLVKINSDRDRWISTPQLMLVRMHVKCGKPLKEWQRFVSLVKQSQELKTVSYHKLYDILKQHQNEVNEIRAERLARTTNPLALVAKKQPIYHPQNHPTQNTQYSSTRSKQFTRNRGKAIVTSSAPTYDPEPTTVTEDDEMSKEKEIDKLMALISLSFKKIYKPTNNNLRTSSNTSRANQDNSPRINRGTGYDNQRAVNVVGARENVGTLVVQKSGIQCYNCKEYGHVSREC